MSSPFCVQYDPESGGVCALSHRQDPSMNFQNGHHMAGTLSYTYIFNPDAPPDPARRVPGGTCAAATVEEVRRDGEALYVRYRTPKLRVDVTRVPEEDRYTETYTFVNDSAVDVFTRRGEIGIWFPLCDRYEGADICLASRAHTHLFCGGNTAWICALRMGLSDINLGVVLTAGSVDAYSVERDPARYSNERGDFLLHPAAVHLAAGASCTLAFTYFFHTGREDFLQKAAAFPAALCVRARTFSVFIGEPLTLTFSQPAAVSDGTALLSSPATTFTFTPQTPGEHRLTLTYADGRHTCARIFVAPAFETLVRARLDFIVSRQQYRGEGALHGAFLLYDNEEEHPYFDNTFSDHNASRERLGMGILLAAWLQNHPDERLREALDLYVWFVEREFFDPATGDVYNTVGKDPSFKRLYNAPWIARFMTELYYLTHDTEYLGKMFRCMERYYAGGGARFYPNGLSMTEMVWSLREAGMSREADRLLSLLRAHVDNMMEIGLHYPKHEVNFEQTIVTPAATFLCQFYLLTGEEKYRSAARGQMYILSRFDGFAPDHHLFEVAIRHWDDFWFGKRAMLGDTFPHDWSILSSVSYHHFYEIGGGKEWEERARAGARACLSLFDPDGRAHAAYLFPYAVNGERGEFYDPYANDQDFALYFYLKYFA